MKIIEVTIHIISPHGCNYYALENGLNRVHNFVYMYVTGYFYYIYNVYSNLYYCNIIQNILYL